VARRYRLCLRASSLSSLPRALSFRHQHARSAYGMAYRLMAAVDARADNGVRRGRRQAAGLGGGGHLIASSSATYTFPHAAASCLFSAFSSLSARFAPFCSLYAHLRRTVKSMFYVVFIIKQQCVLYHDGLRLRATKRLYGGGWRGLKVSAITVLEERLLYLTLATPASRAIFKISWKLGV